VFLVAFLNKLQTVEIWHFNVGFGTTAVIHGVILQAFTESNWFAVKKSQRIDQEVQISWQKELQIDLLWFITVRLDWLLIGLVGTVIFELCIFPRLTTVFSGFFGPSLFSMLWPSCWRRLGTDPIQTEWENPSGSNIGHETMVAPIKSSPGRSLVV